MPFFDPTHLIDSHQRDLPHWQQGEVPIFVTWTLADSLPKEATLKLKASRDHWLAGHPKPWNEKTEKEYYVKFANPINEMLDRGRGSCILRDQGIAMIVADRILEQHEKDAIIHAFVIMPNHVHVLMQLRGEVQLPGIIQRWKGASSRLINQRLGKSGKLWQQEYWDRLIRSRVHFDFVIRYIRGNPQKAGLPAGDCLLWENTGLGL